MATTSRGARSASGCSSAMNATPLLVAQDRTLAPQRLGEQRARHRRVVQRGGVELHELEVGDRGAGAHGHGDAVTGGEGGVGGDGEALAGAARRDEHVAGPHRRPGPRARSRGRPRPRPSSSRSSEASQPSRMSAPEPCTAATSARSTLGAGGVTPRVHDPGDGVPALARAGEVVAAVGLVEVRAQGDELADPGRTLAGQHPHRVDVAETRTRDQRVRPVQLGRVVVGVERGGDPSLRVGGRRPPELTLGEDGDRHAFAAGAHCSGQPRDATPQHEEIGHGAVRPWRSTDSTGRRRVTARLRGSSASSAGCARRRGRRAARGWRAPLRRTARR